MQARRLILRGLTFYWRTNLAVVLGVATAVAVLAGALLVGDSVRGSLRDLVLQRLGRADRAVLASGFFREALADDLGKDESFASAFDGITPLIVMQGLVSDQASGRRASRVQVYGVDERFWRFHEVAAGSGGNGREALLSPALARDIRAAVGSTVLVRVERPSAVPLESLHGRKDNTGRTVRLTVRAILDPSQMGEFSLQPQQGEVRAVFVPLKRLQQDLGVADRVNALLVSDRAGAPDPPAALDAAIKRRFALEDVGLSVRVVTPPITTGRTHGSAPTTSSSPGSAPTRDVATSLSRASARTPDAARSSSPIGGAAPRVIGDARSSSPVVGADPRVGPGVLAVESAAGLLDAARAKAADDATAGAAMKTQPVLTYLANTIRSGDRQVPYSLVTAMDLDTIAPAAAPRGRSKDRPLHEFKDRPLHDVAPGPIPSPVGDGLQTVPGGHGGSSAPIVLNDWTARDLGVTVGDPVTLEYYLWEDPGRLATRTADFELAAIVPIAGAAADRDLAPVYPGITEAKSLGDWDPPFPLDLGRVRRVDEDYWDRYRTTPKAFIPLDVGQRLWSSRFGDRTSLRVAPAPGVPLSEARNQYAARLRAAIDPFALGLAVRDVRADGLAASRGATDFGEYFAYFSFFLVMSALILAALFFRLGVEQRAREVGLLRAVGFSTARVRRLFSAEGFVLAVLGSLLGIAGAIAYGAVMMAGLRTWWSGAVGTTALRLHVSPLSLAAGAAGALIAAMVCIWWTLRGLSGISERSLLAGQIEAAVPPSKAGRPRSAPTHLVVAALFATSGATLLALAFFGTFDRTAAFFGAGTSLLVACLSGVAFTLRRPPRSSLDGHGWWPVWRIGLRNASDRPGRSILAIGVIASATFIVIAVDAFRREGPPATDRHSGVGGYPLLVDLLLPIANDPNTRDGRESLGLNSIDRLTIEPFRVLPGDDASCLNLYEPKNPRVLGVSRPFIESGRFAFQSSLATTDAERINPWLLLNRDVDADIVPVIADANSMTYVLHKRLGDDVVITRGSRTVRLRLVAALADSIFQGELLMSDASFARLFPQQEGYRFLLIDAPEDRVAQVAAAIEEGAGDLGADAVETTARLAEFHTVENTYLSTFQTLGGLGLLLGIVGLGAVVLRNVFERRRELALLGAVGYRRGHIFTIVVAENVLLLAWGLALGSVCALVAIAPAVSERGGRLPTTWSGGALLVAVFLAGLVSSVVATRAALRTPLLSALRSE